jgi:4-fold beta flower protein
VLTELVGAPDGLLQQVTRDRPDIKKGCVVVKHVVCVGAVALLLTAGGCASPGPRQGPAGLTGSNREIPILSSDGAAAAYVTPDLTVYLWSGLPTAYLYPDPAGGFHVYGFNGRHLGWYAAGAMRDHSGLRVGVTNEGFARVSEVQRVRGVQQGPPERGVRQTPPARPVFGADWSRTYLEEFLLQGR